MDGGKDVSEGLSTMLLQADAASGGTDMSFFIMMGAIFMIFYFAVFKDLFNTLQLKSYPLQCSNNQHRFHHWFGDCTALFEIVRQG